MSDDAEHDALTAFQIARRRGYRFSEQRWLESLKGERGERGEKGERGERGPRGLDGQSIKGDRGERGEKGDRGDRGERGLTGADGALPDVVPWKATFERGANRLATKMHIKSADGAAWTGNVLRDPFGTIAEVEFVPVNA